MMVACNRAPKVYVEINDITISMIIDMEASMDIIDEKTFAEVNEMNNLCVQPSIKCSADSQCIAMGLFATNIKVDIKSV